MECSVVQGKVWISSSGVMPSDQGDAVVVLCSSARSSSDLTSWTSAGVHGVGLC